mgnify:FL=1
MKKRIFSTLLALCMLLCLMPTAAFAEESTETPPACSCETTCTTDNMNKECPVCGAEDALPEKCAMCAQPKGEASDSQPKEEVSTPQPEKEVSDPQPEKEVSAPQPETALTALSGEGETPAASGTVTEVSTAEALTAAISGSSFKTVKLAGDIIISSSLTVKRTVTLDLNGHVLKYESANNGSVIVVENGGQLTIEDSNTSKPSHRFKLDGKLWVLDETSGTETVNGGVITGGTGKPIQFGSGIYVHDAYYGGGVYIAPGGQLTMTGGNIVGCSAEFGGGICIESERDGKQGQFSMSGGNIIGCSAECGGGVYVDSESNQSPFSMSGGSIIGCVASDIGGGVRASGTFKMSGQAVIRSCTVESATQSIYGGGIYVNSSSSFEMSGKAKIEYCQAISNSSKSSNGGGVYLTNATTFTLSGNAVIQNCKADNSVTPGETYGGGVSADCMRQITLEGNAQISQCNAANGSGLYITGSRMYPNDWGKLYANGGSVNGDVVLGDKDKYDGPCTITGLGGTVFNGKVTVTPDSTIEKGTFNGEVINNGTITGGVFNSTVSGSGTINGGTFNGTPARVTGNGTENDPYRISTADGLKWFRDKVNSAKTSDETKICAELTKDIDLSGEAWTPIGIGNAFYAGKPPYSGTFDGKGHTIKNLYINNSSAGYVGLFGYVDGGTIRNLTVSGSVKGTEHTGGIAGGADGGTFENCANLCVVQSDSTAGGTTGGIIGFASNMYHELIVRDCYNVGSITGRHAGGIIGHCGGWLETIGNCYNVGKVTGTANAGAIIGNYYSKKISNCYYLEGSVTRAGSGDKMSTSKTAAEFANGTVLNLLKAGERDNNANPWADECKYLDAAGKTLPVFNGQGYTHNHQSDKWESNDTEHWQVCTCGVVFNKAKHSGGKATCKDKAVCEICGKSYGSLDPNNHTDLKHINAKAATAAAEGNIEYWYCEDCDKYFSDAAATKEITKAATVTAKLPKTTSPQPIVEPRPTAQPQQTAQPQPTVQPVSPIPSTGDTANPALWFALLFVSGGAALGTTIIRKKKQ